MPLLFVKIETLNTTLMERFKQTVNCAEIKRNAIAKAKEVAGSDIPRAIKLAKQYYKQLLN